MTRKSIHEWATAVRDRYRRAGRREKGLILDEFCRTTGYRRKAVIRLLGRNTGGGGKRRGRKRTYGPEVVEALKKLWETCDRACSKRLKPFIPELVQVLERHGELRLSEEVRAQVLAVSASTIDRLLKRERSNGVRRPYSQSHSSTSLKAQIPIRTFSEWGEVQPGSFQADLVAHCGESVAGFYLNTLVAVDVATGWSEFEAVWGKGQDRVGGAVDRMRRRLPFEMRELHTDNGGEFINEVFYPYCKRHGIKVTRGRPYKKNDQAYAEQKNWSTVRRTVGYDRYSSKAAFAQLQKTYELLRLYVNFFQPVRKLVGKERQGAKMKKRYDRAQTAYGRLLGAGVLSEEQTRRLEVLYHQLNPVQLKAQIDASLENLWRLTDRSLSAGQGKREAGG